MIARFELVVQFHRFVELLVGVVRRAALAHRVLSDPQRRARYNEIITLCWEVAAEGS